MPRERAPQRAFQGLERERGGKKNESCKNVFECDWEERNWIARPWINITTFSDVKKKRRRLLQSRGTDNKTITKKKKENHTDAAFLPPAVVFAHF